MILMIVDVTLKVLTYGQGHKTFLYEFIVMYTFILYVYYKSLFVSRR